MTFEELADQLTRAAYTASGGILPACENHYQVWRCRHGRVVAAVLRTLAQHPVYEPAAPHLCALADEVLS